MHMNAIFKIVSTQTCGNQLLKNVISLVFFPSFLRVTSLIKSVSQNRIISVSLSIKMEMQSRNKIPVVSADAQKLAGATKCVFN